MKRLMTIITALLMCVMMVMPVAASADTSSAEQPVVSEVSDMNQPASSEDGILEYETTEDGIMLLSEETSVEASGTDETDSMAISVGHPSRMVDEADLLTDAEEDALLTELDEISIRHNFDVVIVTVDSTDRQDMQSFADDYYDYNGYGMGENYDGILLAVNMGTREYYVSTCGSGIDIFSGEVLDYMENEFVPYLSDGDYATAFSEFAQICDYFVTEAENGVGSADAVNGYYGDDYSDYYDSVPAGSSSAAGGRGILGIIPVLIICLVLGFLFAGIPMSRLKKQMRTVAMKAEASDYLKPGSKHITKSRDAFLYSHVNRVPKPKENKSGGGGGGIHMSSSGRMHGGGGGRF